MTRVVGFLLLSMCVSAAFGSVTQPLDRTEVNNKMTSGDNCGLCEWGVTQVEDFLASNYTETKIETVMGDLCNQLPGSLSTLCNEIVVPNIPTIINDIETKESPETICNQLNFCEDQDLKEFYSHFSTPHLYGLMMFMRDHFQSKPVLNEYMMDTMNKYCF